MTLAPRDVMPQEALDIAQKALWRAKTDMLGFGFDQRPERRERAARELSDARDWINAALIGLGEEA